jgi:hypothetical protein
VTARAELEMDDQMARLLALQIRLSLGAQSKAIVELGPWASGRSASPSCWALPTDTAKVTLAKAKKKPAAKKEATGE